MAYTKILTFNRAKTGTGKMSVSNKAQARSALVDGPKAPAYPAPDQPTQKTIPAPQPLRQQPELSIAASTRKSFRVVTPLTNGGKPPIASLFYAFQTFQVANHARNRAHLNSDQYRSYVEALEIMREAFGDAGIDGYFDFENHLPKVMRKSVSSKKVKKVRR